jgi:Helix-hairpin-helix motif
MPMPHPDNDATRRPPRVPVRHPVRRKTYLWLFSLAGALGCIVALANSLAPSPGHHVQPIGGILGGIGLTLCCWIAWHAHRVQMPPRLATPPPLSPIMTAKLRVRQRHEALAILQRDPELAAELFIGRPDLPRYFEDGGLIDANHVPAQFLAAMPGIDQALAEKIVSTRAEIGGFSSIADLEVTLNVSPSVINQIKDHLVFVPMS